MKKLFLTIGVLLVSTPSYSTILECKFDDYFRYYIDYEQKVVRERKVASSTTPEPRKELKTINWFRDQIVVEPTSYNEPVVMISSITGKTLNRKRIVFDRISGNVLWVFDGGPGSVHMGICEILSPKY